MGRHQPVSSDDERGQGWVIVAGVLLLMLGTLNVIDGIAAIGSAHLYMANTTTYSPTSKPGWNILVLGILQLVAGLGLLVETSSRAGPARHLEPQRARATADDPGVSVVVASDLRDLLAAYPLRVGFRDSAVGHLEEEAVESADPTSRSRWWNRMAAL